MATQQELLIKIRGDIADIEKKLGNVRSNLAKTEKSTSGLAKAFTTSAKVVASAGAAMAGAAVLIGKKSLDAAARVEEMENKFNVVFKNSSDDMNAWADTFAKAIGRNNTEIKEAVSNQADLMIGMGMTEETAGDLSKKYTELAYDLASFNNVNDATAVEAMTKAMFGETEMAKQLGLNLSATTMEQSSYVQSLGKTWKEMTQAEKAEAYYQEALKQSTNALGDAERSAGSYTNQQKRLKGNMEKLYETIGQKLLPIFTPLVSAFADVIEKVSEGITAFSDIYKETGNTTDAFQGFLDAIGASGLSDFIEKVQKIPEKLREWEQPLTTAAILVGALAFAIGAYSLAQNWALVTTALGVAGLNIWAGVCGIATAATTILGTVMAFLTSPITLVILAIGALIAIGYLLVKNWDTISAWIAKTWDAIKTKAVQVWDSIDNFLTETFGNIWTNIKSVLGEIWGYWETTWENVKSLFSGVWEGIKGIWNAFGKLFSGDWAGFWEDIKTAFGTIWDSIKTFFSKQLSNFMDLFKNIIPSMLQIGKDIINGLWNGLKNVWSSITGWVEEKANWIKNKFKSVLDINSPSREFMKIGMFVDEGLVKGLEDGELDINNQVTGMAEGLKTGFNSSFEGAEGGAIETNTANTTINLNGSYMFQDKDSMDYFLNRLGMAVARG